MSQWYAKPSGGYATLSNESKNNMDMIYSVFSAQGYTLEAVCAIIGNMANESAMNPWRWQNDTVNYSAGYGLIQFTAARDYINLTGVPYHSPNLSTSSQTSGATPEDGFAQCSVIYNDTLNKWQSNIWRDYWSTQTYVAEYAYMQTLRETYGRYISQDTFKQITDLQAATFIFNGGYVGELVLNFDPRYTDARLAYSYLSGHEPPDPPEPPTPTGDGTLVSILYMAAKKKRANIIFEKRWYDK